MAATTAPSGRCNGNGCNGHSRSVKMAIVVETRCHWRTSLEMSNSHAGANCAVVTGSNGIPFPLTKPLRYINLFLLKNGTVAINNVTVFCQNGYRS